LEKSLWHFVASLEDLKNLPQFSNNQDQLTSFLEDYDLAYDSNKDAIELVLGASSESLLGLSTFN